MNLRLLIVIGIITPCIISCATPKKSKDKATAPEEIKASAQVLFDGTNTDSWRNFKADTISHLWQIEDGALVLLGKGGGDLVSKEQYENFELELEWKISKNGNSGLFYHVSEGDSYEKVYHTGPEFQILDNEGHKDGQIKTHRAGDNYDMQSCVEENVRPVGEWNKIKLSVNKGHVEHWMNGSKVVEFQIGSPAWEAQLAKSKFTKWPDYSRAGKGHIALQDHGDKVWFKNIRITPL